jgi:hypothetical protein
MASAHPPALECRIRDVARRRTPRGWSVVERKPRHGTVGMVKLRTHVIYVPPLVDIEALFVLLHEIGHVENRHLADDGREAPPCWQLEYEAETWAIAAMRAEGFTVSHEMVDAARQNVRHRVQEAAARKRLDLDLENAGPAAIRFAFPRDWRNWA